MIHITDKQNCCGCSACVQACPKHCIAFEGDSEGFSYPVVDKEKCIECGQCEKVCPVICRHDSTIPLKVFAAQNTDEAELLSSSSGGLFM
ncbi:MAG: 4Fe-4S binding protein, partial [Prevotella sp.]|nr:4Fe-4S binding protein [Prevotella sp.]